MMGLIECGDLLPYTAGSHALIEEKSKWRFFDNTIKGIEYELRAQEFTDTSRNATH